MDTAVAVRALSRADLSRVADVHLGAFPTGALSALGHEVVRRNYLWLLEGPHQAHSLGAFAGGVLVAFCVGGRFNGALTGFLHANRAHLALRVLTHPWLAVSPLFRDRIRLAGRLLLARARGAKPSPAPADPRPPAYGILAIGVDPTRQGTGAGKALMRRHEEIARAAGFDRMELCVAATNTQAIAFYERLGWHKSIDDGRWQKNGVMVRAL